MPDFDFYDYAAHSDGRARYVSFSVFTRTGNAIPREFYIAGICHNAQLISEVYKGWRMLLYVPRAMSESFIGMIETMGVEVRRMPFDASRWMEGMFWRFYAGDDEQKAERFIVRDLDSRLTWRERRAVDDWTRAGTEFHSIRDNRLHSIPVMGGMWGMRAGALRRLANTTVERLAERHTGSRAAKGDDQTFMRAQVWPIVQHSSNYTLTDSFATSHSDCSRTVRCTEWPGSNDDRITEYNVPKRPSYFIGDAHQQDSDVNMTYDCLRGPICVRVQRWWGDSYRLLTGKFPPANFLKMVM